MTSTSRRPGAAAFALLMIIVITAGWWALALWPLGSVEPEWLARTRAACFGSPRGGLPALSGWILLVGEPIGMLGFLIAAWGDALREDLRRIRHQPGWRAVAVLTLLLIVAGLSSSGYRVALAMGLTRPQPVEQIGGPVASRIDASEVRLVDQEGREVSLAEAAGGRPALVTFAFGHCSTVCPTIIHDLLTARRTSADSTFPLLVVSLDPWRDTPSRLATIASQWELGPRDRLLSGPPVQVERALDVLQISRTRDTITGDIAHVAAILAVDDHGIVTQRLDGGWGRLRELIARMPPRTP